RASLLSTLLTVDNLQKHFPIKGGLLKRTVGHIKAVDGISFDLAVGETLGIVGESGCGKSTTGKMIAKIMEPTGGTITFEGNDITQLKGRALKRFRQEVQMVFQDPYASLNPRMAIQSIIAEPLEVNNVV